MTMPKSDFLSTHGRWINSNNRIRTYIHPHIIRVALFNLIVVYFPILFQINIYYKSTYSNQVSLSYVAIYVTKASAGLEPAICCLQQQLH